MLPPYDTAATLARLARLIARYAPRVVVALGDSFHDGGGPARLAQADRDNLHALQRGRDWLWLAGNHDPEPASNIGGTFHATLALGALTFRHLPAGSPGEIAGHLHPVARVAHRGRALSRRCFAADASRLVMPAFGAFAGGLNVRDRSLRGSVRHDSIHRAYAGRGPALFLRGQALPAGLGRGSFTASQIVPWMRRSMSAFGELRTKVDFGLRRFGRE